MNDFELRQLIRMMLESSGSEDKDDEGPDDLLTEPDLPPGDDEDQKEASMVGSAGGSAPSGAMRGVTTPLGTGPTHPHPRKKKKKASSKKKPVGVSSFGGGSKA